MKLELLLIFIDLFDKANSNPCEREGFFPGKHVDLLVWFDNFFHVLVNKMYGDLKWTYYAYF